MSLRRRIEDILPEPWDKGIGRPKSLSLREAIMVTLLYKYYSHCFALGSDMNAVSSRWAGDATANRDGE